MQLRKICQHPFLFDSVEDKINPGGMIDDKIHRVAGKFELLHRVLPKFFAMGHRVFSFHYRFDLTANLGLGSHLLPNDEGHGYYGGFPQVPRV